MRYAGIIATGAAFAASSGAVAEGPTRIVQINQATLLSAPEYLAEPVGVLKYKEQVTTKKEKKPFVQVTSGAKSGWVQETALLAKSKELDAAATDPAKLSKLTDNALAGRGLNETVEAQYRKEHPDAGAAFTSLDAALTSPAQAVTRQDIRNFVAAGNLKPATGGAK